MGKTLDVAGKTGHLYREEVSGKHKGLNWKQKAGIGIGTVIVIGGVAKGPDIADYIKRHYLSPAQSASRVETVPAPSSQPPIVAKYDPSNINQVASAFVTYVRDGNKKGLKDVTLGMSGSDYYILSLGKIENFEIAAIAEGPLTESQKELALEKYGIPLEKSATVNLGVKLNTRDDITGANLGMVYSDKTKSWYIISVF
jgi:hypothetical protein